MAHVFLSYAREDKALARKLAAWLENAGWSVWCDWKLKGGQEWSRLIQTRLADAGCVVVLWSRHSVTARWVLAEANAGLDRGVLVPVLAEPIVPPFGFDHIHAVDLSTWSEADLREVAAAIAQHIPPEPGVQPAYSPPATAHGPTTSHAGGALHDADGDAVAEVRSTYEGTDRASGVARALRLTRNRLVAIGLGAVLALAAAYAVVQWRHDRAALAWAEQFLGLLVSSDYTRAVRAAEYEGDSDAMSRRQEFQACFESTVLADIASFRCSDTSGSFVRDDRVHVDCTVTARQGGSSEITIDVNSPADLPYLAFVWFEAGASTGPEWHTDRCARWSGSRYVGNPPPGRVRPEAPTHVP